MASSDKPLKLKDLFERSIWQRTEMLKLIEKLPPEGWQRGGLDSVFVNLFELVKSEWEMLERIEGREPVIVNDDDLDGDPAAEIEPHALTIVWLRSRDGGLSLWKQNEARKADLLIRYDEIDLEKKFSYILPDALPPFGTGKSRELTLSTGQVIWMMMQPLTTDIRGLRYALSQWGCSADLARIFSLPHEGPPPGPIVEVRPWTGQ